MTATHPGLPWRILAQHPTTGPVEHGSTEHPDAGFDELVVAQWLHVEQMDGRVWWANIGNVTLIVRVRQNGRPESVTVYGPADYAGGPADGCSYELAWTPVAGQAS